MIAIINAKIVTITNGTIENGVLLVEEGKIKAYGADVAVPENAEIIDAKGGWLTPGFIEKNALFDCAVSNCYDFSINNSKHCFESSFQNRFRT